MQALILIDFLLSLTPKAKKKFVGKGNKAVLYSYVLSDEDVRKTIAVSVLCIERNSLKTYLDAMGYADEV